LIRDFATLLPKDRALLGKTSQLGDIFDFVRNYERGCWEEISSPAARPAIQEDAISALYIEGVEWARQILSGHEEPAATPA
jgi:c-di-GMP-related signal transduction protein